MIVVWFHFDHVSSSSSFSSYIILILIEFQVIYDLLEKSSGHLELREDPDQGITVAGLRCIKVLYLSH